jgi:hypothetical protein
LVRLESETLINFKHSANKFMDSSFPTDMTSLFWKYEGKKSMDAENTYKTINAWKTPAELDGAKPSLWGSKGIRPAAINQGNLGDCWWLASMAAIAEWDDRI